MIYVFLIPSNLLMLYFKMIEFRQVSQRYPGRGEVLSHLNFRLLAGEMVYLTGHSGAGKTTFIKLMALLERPSFGFVLVNGAVGAAFSRHASALYRQSLGLVTERPYLLPHRSVFDNVALPLVLQGTPKSTINQAVHAVLDRFGLLNKAQRSTHLLSAGEQQRVAVARAIVHKPRLLLVDEPTTHWDPLLSFDMFNYFQQLNQAGMTILIATHDLALIAPMAHRVLRLTRGMLC